MTLKKLKSNSNSNLLTLKKLNSNSNSLTLKKINSNSQLLTLQKSNSNSDSNSSIARERIQIQIQSNPIFHTKDSKRILQFYQSKLQSRSHRCVLAHHRCAINQELKSLESSIGSSAVARANEVRGHQPKVGEALKFPYKN